MHAAKVILLLRELPMKFAFMSKNVLKFIHIFYGLVRYILDFFFRIITWKDCGIRKYYFYVHCGRSNRPNNLAGQLHKRLSMFESKEVKYAFTRGLMFYLVRSIFMHYLIEIKCLTIILY